MKPPLSFGRRMCTHCPHFCRNPAGSQSGDLPCHSLNPMKTRRAHGWLDASLNRLADQLLSFSLKGAPFYPYSGQSLIVSTQFLSSLVISLLAVSAGSVGIPLPCSRPNQGFRSLRYSDYFSSLLTPSSSWWLWLVPLRGGFVTKNECVVGGCWVNTSRVASDFTMRNTFYFRKFLKIPKPIPWLIKPKLGMFVLILMHFLWWF